MIKVVVANENLWAKALMITAARQTQNSYYSDTRLTSRLTLKWQEFRIQNNAPKTKENDVKTILFSLAYITPIKLMFSRSTGIGLPSGQCYKH